MRISQPWKVLRRNKNNRERRAQARTGNTGAKPSADFRVWFHLFLVSFMTRFDLGIRWGTNIEMKDFAVCILTDIYYPSQFRSKHARVQTSSGLIIFGCQHFVLPSEVRSVSRLSTVTAVEGLDGNILCLPPGSSASHTHWRSQAFHS